MVVSGEVPLHVTLRARWRGIWPMAGVMQCVLLPSGQERGIFECGVGRQYFWHLAINFGFLPFQKLSSRINCHYLADVQPGLLWKWYHMISFPPWAAVASTRGLAENRQVAPLRGAEKSLDPYL